MELRVVDGYFAWVVDVEPFGNVGEVRSALHCALAPRKYITNTLKRKIRWDLWEQKSKHRRKSLEFGWNCLILIKNNTIHLAN